MQRSNPLVYCEELGVNILAKNKNTHLDRCLSPRAGVQSPGPLQDSGSGVEVNPAITSWYSSACFPTREMMFCVQIARLAGNQTTSAAQHTLHMPPTMPPAGESRPSHRFTFSGAPSPDLVPLWGHSNSVPQTLNRFAQGSCQLFLVGPFCLAQVAGVKHWDHWDTQSPAL